jgi:solute:Na+ symporter, SSS family
MPPEAETTLAASSRGLQSLDYALIAAYMVGTLGIAWWFGRKQKNTDDYFVGGRSMPWYAVGLSILATLFSTLTYLGMPGEVITYGPRIYFGYLTIPFTACVITRLWIPFFMRLRLVSAYEYLERRFSYPLRAVGAALFISLRLGWMSMVIYAASDALNRVKGRDFEFLVGNDLYWIMGIIGLTAAVYTAIGGIQAMIWTDVLQCLLLLFGVLMAIFYVVWADGTGPIDWYDSAAAIRDTVINPKTGRRILEETSPWYSFDLTARMTVLTVMLNNFFWTTCTHGSDQVVLQRYFSTSSLKTARKSYFVNLGVDLSMAFLLAMTGLALAAFYVSRVPFDGKVFATGEGGTPPDKLFQYFLGHQLPIGCAGLVIAAFLCDAIQTLQSGVNAITAVVTNDYIPRLRSGKPRLVSDLTFARIAALAITLLVTCNAYFVNYIATENKWTLVTMMPKFFNMFIGPLAGMFVIGMFCRRARTRSALCAALVGIPVAVLWSWWPQITGSKVEPAWALSIALPCVATITVGFLLSFFEERSPHAGEDYTWRSIIRRIPGDPPETVVEQPTATPVQAR